MTASSGPFPRLSGSYGALREEQSWLVTASLIVIAAVAGAAALAYMRPVMVPFVLALFFYYLVAPFADGLEKHLRMPRWLSVLLTLLLVAAILALLALLITTSASGLADSADIYREELVGLAERAFAVLDRYDVDLGQESFLQSLQQLPIGRILRTTAGTVLVLVTNGFLVLIFVIFLLIARRRERRPSRLYSQINTKIRKFIVTKFLISAATGLLVGMILAVLGLDLALVFGVLAFLLNFVPNVGSVVATILPLPVALVQPDFSTLMVVLVVVLPGSVQITMGNVVEPKMMGEGLDLSPVTILVALVFWGLIWGIVGMLLAAPMTAVLRIILARFRTTRSVAELLAGRFPGDVPAEA